MGDFYNPLNELFAQAPLVCMGSLLSVGTNTLVHEVLTSTAKYY